VGDTAVAVRFPGALGGVVSGPGPAADVLVEEDPPEQLTRRRAARKSKRQR
jgi:hypothetical protein